MTARTKCKLGLSALALGVATLGGSIDGLSLSAIAGSGQSAKKAEAEARDARKALAKRRAPEAVQHAEAAVANDPTNGRYRALLGQAYLLAGRFASAGQALTDALTLNPEDGRVALNLALARIAQGDWAGARQTLQTHADQIPASDRGLGFALAGDPVTAIEILTPAVRDPGATAKTRQNLALSLALAGRWREASEIAAMDVAPDQLQARLLEWASFSRPTSAYDQVASLLGVRPVQDVGQPIALALSHQAGVAVAAATPPSAVPVDAYMPGAGADASPPQSRLPPNPSPSRNRWRARVRRSCSGRARKSSSPCRASVPRQCAALRSSLPPQSPWRAQPCGWRQSPCGAAIMSSLAPIPMPGWPKTPGAAMSAASRHCRARPRKARRFRPARAASIACRSAAMPAPMPRDCAARSRPAAAPASCAARRATPWRHGPGAAGCRWLRAEGGSTL